MIFFLSLILSSRHLKLFDNYYEEKSLKIIVLGSEQQNMHKFVIATDFLCVM